jgi:hypothetical protein
MGKMAAICSSVDGCSDFGWVEHFHLGFLKSGGLIVKYMYLDSINDHTVFMEVYLEY